MKLLRKLPQIAPYVAYIALLIYRDRVFSIPEGPFSHLATLLSLLLCAWSILQLYRLIDPLFVGEDDPPDEASAVRLPADALLALLETEDVLDVFLLQEGKPLRIEARSDCTPSGSFFDKAFFLNGQEASPDAIHTALAALADSEGRVPVLTIDGVPAEKHPLAP